MLNTRESNPEDNLLVKQFNGWNIAVYGTYEEPLFNAKDIGNLLGIKDIKSTIGEFDSDEVHSMQLGDLQDNMLTEPGLYKLLMTSRKSIAKQFQKWVFNVIKEMRLHVKEAKELQLKEMDRELQLYKEKTYEEIEKDGHLYVIKTDGGKKVGKTKDTVSKRLKGLQTGNVEDIQILYDFPTSNPDLLEKVVHYILDRYRCNSNREFFDCNTEYIITIITTCGDVIDTLKSSFQTISEEELFGKLNENVRVDLSPRCDQQLDSESSNEYCQKNNEFFNWLEDNIEYKPGCILQLAEVCELYLGEKVGPRIMTKFKKEIEKYIKEKMSDVKFEYQKGIYKDHFYRGWLNVSLK